MGLKIVRFQQQNNIYWGVVKEQKIAVLTEQYDTLASFLKDGISEAKAVTFQENNMVSFDDVKLLSPVTSPAQIICQGVNYSAHREEAGFDKNRPPYNLIFGKATSSLTGALDDIVRPSHVQLLDYEVELGIVIGQSIDSPLEITDNNIHEYVAGIVVTNDVSARDVQLVEGQWLKGKSYRTFCPVGPYLFLLDKEEFHYIHDLTIKLSVNGEIRQQANTKQLLFKPAETLTELSTIVNLNPGDLILTGTPGGVALNLTPEEMAYLASPLTAYEDKVSFLHEQRKRSSYLNNGDIIRAEICSPDGKVNLGVQENRIITQEEYELKKLQTEASLLVK